MVNVGGRSKGCTTCRKRHIKCDLTRPICGRCQKTGLWCDGPKDTTFITATIVKSRRSQPVHDKPDARKQDLAVQPILQPSLVLRHNEREVSICYTRKHLLPNGPIDFALQKLKLTDINKTTVEVCRKLAAQPFNLAAVSFAMVYFGTQHRQTNLKNEGYAFYGQALKRLSHSLSDLQPCSHDEALLSVVTLAMLEIVVPTGPTNYLKHMLGLERLLELRGPKSLISSSPTSSTLYKGVRQMILFASVRSGRPSILAKPEWKAALRAHCFGEELQEQDLYDALADCTVLLAGRDKKSGSWDVNDTSLNLQPNDLECKAMSLLADMRSWKARWDCDEENAYLEEDSHSVRRPASEHLDDEEYSAIFPTILRFVGDSSSRMLMLYNTTLIYILRSLTSMPTEHYPDHFYPSPSHSDEQQQYKLWKCIAEGRLASAERFAALGVARCIPDYLSRKQMYSNGQFSSPVVQWAVTTAWAILGGNGSADGRWMMELLNGNTGHVIEDGVWEKSLTAGKTSSTILNSDKPWDESSC